MMIDTATTYEIVTQQHVRAHDRELIVRNDTCYNDNPRAQDAPYTSLVIADVMLLIRYKPVMTRGDGVLGDGVLISNEHTISSTSIDPIYIYIILRPCG